MLMNLLFQRGGRRFKLNSAIRSNTLGAKRVIEEFNGFRRIIDRK